MLSREKAHRPIKTYSGVRAIHPQRQNNLYTFVLYQNFTVWRSNIWSRVTIDGDIIWSLAVFISFLPQLFYLEIFIDFIHYIRSGVKTSWNFYSYKNLQQTESGYYDHGIRQVQYNFITHGNVSDVFTYIYIFIYMHSTNVKVWLF